jgi:hypothetical protein
MLSQVQQELCHQVQQLEGVIATQREKLVGSCSRALSSL